MEKLYTRYVKIIFENGRWEDAYCTVHTHYSNPLAISDENTLKESNWESAYLYAVALTQCSMSASTSLNNNLLRTCDNHQECLASLEFLLFPPKRL